MIHQIKMYPPGLIDITSFVSMFGLLSTSLQCVYLCMEQPFVLARDLSRIN